MIFLCVISAYFEPLRKTVHRRDAESPEDAQKFFSGQTPKQAEDREQ